MHTTARSGRIGVIACAARPEREASMRAAQAVLAALRDEGLDAVTLFADRELDLALRQERIGVAFLALRGRAAAGPVQGLLEIVGVPYTGSSFSAASLAADRLKSKEQLRLHNLPTPSWYRHLRGLGSAVEQHRDFGFPCVVKPRTGGGRGAGVAIVQGEEELAAAVDVGLRIDDELVVERHIEGMRVEVVIVDGEVLGAAEVLGGPGARASRGEVHIPPRLGHERLRGALTQSIRAYHLLGCNGAARVDLVVSERLNEQVLGVDAAPDLAPGGLLAVIAQAAGLRFPGLIVRLLAGARLHVNRRMRERRVTQVPLLAPDRRIAGGAGPH